MGAFELVAVAMALGKGNAAAELGGGGGTLYPVLDPIDTVVLSAVVWVLGVAVTLWPARSAAHIAPVVAMNTQ